MKADDFREYSRRWEGTYSTVNASEHNMEHARLWLALAELTERVEEQDKLIRDLRFPPETPPTDKQTQERSKVDVLTERVEALEGE